jgi:hypothetical protein
MAVPGSTQGLAPAWHPTHDGLADLLPLLKNALSTDNAVQRKVQEVACFIFDKCETDL